MPTDPAVSAPPTPPMTPPVAGHALAVRLPASVYIIGAVSMLNDISVR